MSGRKPGDRPDVPRFLPAPAASPNPPMLDAVLARLLLAVRPNAEPVLEELERLAGPAEIKTFAAFEGMLPA